MKSIVNLPKNIANFIKNVYLEIKQVEFPTRKDSFKNTNLVIVVSVIAGLFLLLADTLFMTIRNFIIESI